MLVIDDCSTDNSAEIIKRYTEQDSRIKYYKTAYPSGSPSLPRNIGIDCSDGEYITFLDSDDVWLPDKLDKQLTFMIANNYALTYSYYEKIDYSGNRNDRIIKTRNETTYENLLKSNSIPLLTSIVSREAIGAVRFKHIPQEDFCFWLDILKQGYEAHNLQIVTALYRIVDNSRSAKKASMFKGYWDVLRKHQHINLIKTFYYSITYAFCGIIKYLK